MAPARVRYSRVAKQVPAAAADDADRPSGDSAADVAIHRSRPTKSSRFRRSRSIGSFLHAVVTRASILYSRLDIYALPTRHHFHRSLSPVISLSSGILYERTSTQTLAEPSSNLVQRTRSDHRGGRAQPGRRIFMRLEIWRKIGLSAGD